MHESCFDAFLEVLEVPYQDDKRILIRARWWNLGYTGNPWCLGMGADTVEIARSDLTKWKNINSAVTSVRTKPGVPGGV